MTSLIPSAEAAASDLFFSEYIEGSSFNKALEIYNGTGTSIDLGAGQYRLELYSNGSATVSQAINLTGTVAAGDVFVIAHSSANATILAQADVTNNSVLNHNGDDAFVLRKGGAGGAVLDAIGQVGVDPGLEWGTGLTSTADNTLRRKSNVCAGDTNPSNAFDPAVEWDGFVNDTSDGFGSHAALCGSATPTPTPTPTATPTPTPTATPTPTPTDASSVVVISQVYGGGGNSGATFRNDYVELYNRGSATIDLVGWSVQYASATNTSTWSGVTPLAGTVAPGQYYLVRLASGGAVGAELPEANTTGEINMSGTNGKVALVSNSDPLNGACPLSDPDIADLVGYGTANCREGDGNAPAPSNNATALFRKSGGATDTNQNGSDFETGIPNPRRTAPFVEVGPSVTSTDPRPGGSNAPRDASVTVNFSEPVNVTGAWYDINCADTGNHNDATVAANPNGKSFVITPNVNFQAGEQCTVTVKATFVSDQDTDDALPNTDTLAADFTSTFTVSTGTAPPYGPDVHLTMGNPTGAVRALNSPNNYLMEKPEFALSYSRDKGTANWVSWHLSDEWVGSLQRVDTFRPDPEVPADWYRVQATDYFSSGFDRGHMVPNADRDKETSSPINQATFLMTNMIPQAPDNNQGPWANLENYLRTLLPANEIYIVAGGAGVGGAGSNGPATTIANGRVTVPEKTWKVALVLPKGDNDLSRVSATARTIAVIMPNTQGIRTNNPNDWEAYLTSVDAVEALTGYDFFANVADPVENGIEAGVNGNNPPVADDQPSVTTEEDTSTAITLTATGVKGPLTYTVLTQPSNGTLTGAGDSYTYTPNADFNGADSFTFRANDGEFDSNVATVTISVTPVNDAPTLAPIGPRTVLLGETLAFTAAGADVDDPAQTLTYSLTGAVPSGASIDPATGAFIWTPNASQVGAVYTFGVRVTDGGGLFAEEQVSVAVAYTWSGFLPPINPAGGSVFKLGRTIPVKFKLTGASAGITNAVARLFVAKISDDVVGTEEEADSTSAATSGNLFRYDAGEDQYIFNLSTRGLTAGTYQLRVDTGDGVLRAVNISIRN